MPGYPKIHNVTIQVRMARGLDIKDITVELNAAVSTAQIENGMVYAVCVGSTGSLTTIEFEPGVVEDLKRAITALAPEGADYAHEAAWHDGNGHSHVQAALLGPSLALPVRNGHLQTGTWQQPVIINHDNKARMRTIEVTLIGTTR